MACDIEAARLSLWIDQRLRDEVQATVSAHIFELAESLTAPEGFASRDGSYGISMAVFCIAAYKVISPQCNVRFFSDMNRFNPLYPSFRSVAKIISAAARNHFDHSLISADLGAGVRRSLMNPTVFDWNYEGSFHSDTIRTLFLKFIDLIETGHAIEVFDAMALRYRHLSKRRCAVPVMGPVDQDLALMIITCFLKDHAGDRAETVVWSAAHERDRTVSRKTTLQSNDKSGVGDIDGTNYTVEVKSGLVTLAMLQESCKKAIVSGHCERVTLVTTAKPVFASEMERNIMTFIRRQYPELSIKAEAWEDFLIQAVGNETGQVTWKGLLDRISNSVKSLQPYHSDQWNDLIELYILNQTVSLDGNIFRFAA